MTSKPNAMACFGDSGGPQLQKGRDERWELVGVTSGPGAPNVPCSQGPGLYTNVPAYADWIQATLRANSVKAVAEGGSGHTETGKHDNFVPISAVTSALVLAAGGTTLALRRRKPGRTD
ncbi:trypsin-like serine protease [Kitasatospora sp. NPDC101155]|uniref:trypsin-like serine protease n=1 Tax=Kitasatospora sp. NPDC101155 TaxID=3364097 RepID=UPI003807FEC5